MKIESIQKLLVIAAHPDDEILGCGGTIARIRKQGGQVRIVFLAEGVTARYEPEEFDSPEVIEASRRRNENALKALAEVNVEPDTVYLNRRPCCRLDQVPLIDLTKEIERHSKEFEPDLLLTHAANDVNIDHALTHRATLAATRPVGDKQPLAILAFEVLSSTEWNTAAPFPANTFIDITEVIDNKIRALAAYKDEMREPPHPRSEHALRGLAAFRGAQCGATFAEGFSLIRMIAR